MVYGQGVFNLIKDTLQDYNPLKSVFIERTPGADATTFSDDLILLNKTIDNLLNMIELDQGFNNVTLFLDTTI
jgi:hypothetical protein